MYLRILNVKKSEKNYKYLKLVETARSKGKVVQKTLLNFGNIEQWPPEKLKEFIYKLDQFYSLELGPTPEDLEVYHAFEFGACFALDSVWKTLNISEAIRNHMKEHRCDIDIVPPVKAMVFNRLLEPSSKLRVYEWVKTRAIQEVLHRDIPLHHYYRSLDYLMDHKSSLEEDIFWSVNDIFNLDLSLVFYDLTSSYFEGDCCELAHHGYSRDHRPDRRQIEIGLLVNREGIPIAHEVWEGNIKDSKTVPDALETMQKRFRIKRCIFVGDNAMATPENIALLREKNYEYITSLKLLKDSRALSLLKSTSLPDYGQFTKLRDNLFVHEVFSPSEGFHPDERVIISYNPERARITRQKRHEKLTRSRKYLQSIIDTPPKKGRRRTPQKITEMVERYLHNRRTHKYFTYGFTKEGTFEFHDNLRAIDHAQRKDGICMLVTNSPTLTMDEIALGYRTLSEVEHAFKEIKNFLRIRPIYHYKELRVRGHVFICVLAYLLEKVIEKKLKGSQNPLSPQKALQMLVPIHLVNCTIMGKPLHRVTKITRKQHEIYNTLGSDKIPKTPVF